jgi:asparagine synthase (glutamine-hydrolysing)
MAASQLLPVGVPGRTYLSSYRDGIMQSVEHLGLYFDAAARRALKNGRPAHSTDALTPERRRGQRAHGGSSPIQKLTRADFGTYMVDDILVKVDRASMLASLEVRAPWLDHHIIEFAFSQVPDHLRATRSSLKVLPKMLGKHLLPSKLDLNRKQGFSIPLAKWFKGDWGVFFTDVLSQADPAILNPKAVRSLLRGQRMGLNNAERLFALTLFELWRREYRISV